MYSDRRTTPRSLKIRCSVRPLLDWVVTKPTKEFIDGNGHRKVKGNVDIELAVESGARIERRHVRGVSRD